VGRESAGQDLGRRRELRQGDGDVDDVRDLYRVRFTPDGKYVLARQPETGSVLVCDAATRAPAKREVRNFSPRRDTTLLTDIGAEDRGMT
jgi:hypothetical protein